MCGKNRQFGVLIFLCISFHKESLSTARVLNSYLYSYKNSNRSDKIQIDASHWSLCILYGYAIMIEICVYFFLTHSIFAAPSQGLSMFGASER